MISTEEDLFNQMIPTDQIRKRNRQYELLPESIKTIYTEAEWLWLSEGQKHDLVTRETEPEVEG